MKKCPYCSAEILDDAEFCLYCMRQLTQKTAVKNKIKKSYWLVAFIGVLLALIACAVVLLVIKFSANGSQGYMSSGGELAVIYTSQSGVVSDGESINRIDDLIDTNDSVSEKDTVYSSSDTPSSATKTPDTDKVGSGDTNTHNTVTSNSTAGDDNSSVDDKDTGSSSSTSNDSSSTDNNSSGAQLGDSSSQQPSSMPTSSDNIQEQPLPTWSVKTVDGGIEITGIANYNTTGNYEIPSQIDGKTVVGIGYRAFYYETSLKSVTLPDTLKYIDEQAFAYCSSLIEIIIPASVTEIRNNAFLPCDKLADIYIASTNISIANYAFSSSNQRSVTLTIHAPSSVMDSMKARIYWSAEYEEWNG